MSFDQAFALTVSPAVEGGFSCASNDAGNWTGGAVGAGELLGTRYGISAAFLHALPATDQFARKNPSALTLAECSAIYRAHFWDAVAGDALPGPIGGLMFDAAVNQGPGWACRCLQTALGVAADGTVGPKTLAAVRGAAIAPLHAEIARVRDERYRASADWSVFGVGWARRLMTVVAATASFAEEAPSQKRLGRLPAKRDARVPRLAAIAPALPSAPARMTAYADAVKDWILGENDRIGDCTCVAPANAILALTTLAQAPRRLPDWQIVAFYASVTGYSPVDPASDTGAAVEDILAAWHGRGIAADRLDGYATLDLRDHERVRQAIAHLGPVDLGINLPNGWMQADTWDVATAGGALAGGHCVTAVGYTETGLQIVSWGRVYDMTWAGWDAFVEEAHLLLSHDALRATGRDTAGVDWDALERIMAALRYA